MTKQFCPLTVVGDSVLGCLGASCLVIGIISHRGKFPCLDDLVGIYKPWYGFKENKTI